MKKTLIYLLFLLLATSCNSPSTNSNVIETDVLVIGGGASGTMAGIQAARMGVQVTIVEETPWLGGMLTAAGVSAVDGNYKLYSGLWEEFRQNLYDHYGGADSLKTGWVSNVLFEPSIGAKLLADMAKKEDYLNVMQNVRLIDIEKEDSAWMAIIQKENQSFSIMAKIVIDGTELGDVSKMVGIPYDIGMDSRTETGEAIAPEQANDIVQDMTYVAILKDYGKGVDKTIKKPEGYDPTPYFCTCAGWCDEEKMGRKLWDCDAMMNYGKLPNGYYMINWPINGNDYYLNVIELSPRERATEFQKAKQYTLNYLYYLQSELGYKHLGIADDIFPTSDGLPFFPYHRESRRIKGIVQFTVNDIARPFEQEHSLYRTGIAVGDYPVDHHHDAYPESEKLPDLHFYPVPSYTLPLGTLIPKERENFIVAEKSISVSNLVNGTTRLQPVCLLIGQAAGTLAALSVKEKTTPRNVPVRQVQQALINAGAYLLPYVDTSPEQASFYAIQRIGATGILKGEGKNVGWENKTLFYPDNLVTKTALEDGLREWINLEEIKFQTENVSLKEALELIQLLGKQYNISTANKAIEELLEAALLLLQKNGFIKLEMNASISREAFAVILDALVGPFELRQVDHWGHFSN